ncbi:MAG: prolipoprotein diacylglyceryl transferase [Lachnospiraceae bacterium]|nr:prolipoprotein diacylglyceryl transferase [Lachnospiraceae bacterium]MDD3616013.1 prolipoprotein diacylglyceryl transferase [Lachnospiraceae bacterium]
MDMEINFPNLGIHLDHVGKYISILGFDIAYYGIIIAIGMVLGVAVACKEAKRTNQNPENYMDLLMWAILLGVIGARVYYVVFAWDYYKDNLLNIFNIRQGGLAIYGGIITGVIVVFIFTKKKKMPIWLALDTCCMGLLTGQILGRWGNFFNREAFGQYTDNLLAMQLPVSAIRSNEITTQMMEHAQEIAGVQYVQVHPTFLYESMWNLCVLLIVFLFRKKKKFDGQLFLMYVVGYGLGRFWIESLRTDQLLIPGIGLPISQVLAACFVVGAIVLMLILHKKKVRVE